MCVYNFLARAHKTGDPQLVSATELSTVGNSNASKKTFCKAHVGARLHIGHSVFWGSECFWPAWRQQLVSLSRPHSINGTLAVSKICDA